MRPEHRWSLQFEPPRLLLYSQFRAVSALVDLDLMDGHALVQRVARVCSGNSCVPMERRLADP